MFIVKRGIICLGETVNGSRKEWKQEYHAGTLLLISIIYSDDILSCFLIWYPFVLAKKYFIWEICLQYIPLVVWGGSRNQILPLISWGHFRLFVVNLIIFSEGINNLFPKPNLPRRHCRNYTYSMYSLYNFTLLGFYCSYCHV